MPPRTRKETPEAILFVDESKPMLSPDPMPNVWAISVGDFVHIVTVGGAKYKSCELLDLDSRGVTIRTNPLGPTQAEISYIPWTSIDGAGLIGKR